MQYNKACQQKKKINSSVGARHLDCRYTAHISFKNNIIHATQVDN